MKPIITIDGYDAGILSDATIQARNGLSWCAGINTQKEKGILQVSQKLVAIAQATSANNINESIYWMVDYIKNSKIYALGNGGDIYAYSLSQSTKWALIHDSAYNNFSGMIEYNSELFYASNNYLGRMVNDTLDGDHNNSATTISLTDATNFHTSGTITIGSEVITYTGKSTNDLTGCTRGARGSTAAAHSGGAVVYGFKDSYKSIDLDVNRHPMTIYMGKLMGGAGGYIFTLDSDGTWVKQALTLPAGYKVKSLEVYGDRLVIGTQLGSQSKAVLFTWDGVSDLPEDTFILKEKGITAMANWRNNLICFAGDKGNIYAFNGAALDKIITIPHIAIGGSFNVKAGAVDEYMGDLVFGFNHPNKDPAIYCLSKEPGKGMTLTISHILSGGLSDDISPNALLQTTTGIFYVAWRNLTESTYGIDKIDTSNKIVSTAYSDSQVYEIQLGNQPQLIKGVELIAKPMASGTKVNIDYKLDSAASWSDLGDINSSNQHQVLKGIGARAKTIQIRLNFTASSNNSPEISKINIY